MPEEEAPLEGCVANFHESAEGERHDGRREKEDHDDGVGDGLGEIASELSFVDGEG